MSNHGKIDRTGRRTGRWLIAAVLGAVGVGLAYLSWLVRFDDPWWSSTLGNMAVAVLLLVPAEWALNWARIGFKRITRAAEQAQATAQEAVNTANQTARSLDEVRDSLLQRQFDEHETHLDMYRHMFSDPSREALIRGLRRAADESITSPSGVRSPIWESDLHYRFVLGGPDEDSLTINVETDDGTVLTFREWNDGVAPVDFYQQLVEAVREVGGDLGVGLNLPTESVKDLSEMLEFVAEKRSQELAGHRSTLKHIIERREGWFFTDEAVLPKHDLGYRIDVDRLDEMDWENHLRGKTWYDASYALDFARRLYHVQEQPPKTRPTSGPPLMEPRNF
ncbi:hypothetical protein [Brevibacterium sediminis]|uniref:hypothetical protein n=1 Tax=Brevibacterium sediminis TaxID=1857024 RepID=UPI003B3BA4B4